MKFSECPGNFISGCSYRLISFYAWTPKWSRICILTTWERTGGPCTSLSSECCPLVFSALASRNRWGKITSQTSPGCFWREPSGLLRGSTESTRAASNCWEAAEGWELFHTQLCAVKEGLDGSGCTPATGFVIAALHLWWAILCFPKQWEILMGVLCLWVWGLTEEKN